MVYLFFCISSFEMNNKQMYLAALMLAGFVIAAYAEPLPEESAAEAEPKTGNDKHLGADSEPKTGAEPENSAPMFHGQLLTTVVSFLAYLLLKWVNIHPWWFDSDRVIMERVHKFNISKAYFFVKSIFKACSPF